MTSRWGPDQIRKAARHESLLNTAKLTQSDNKVLTVQMDSVASAADNLKVGDQKKTEKSHFCKFRKVPNAPGNQKQSVYADIIVPLRIPLQLNHSYTHGCSRKKKYPQKKWNPPSLPLEATLNGYSHHDIKYMSNHFVCECVRRGHVNYWHGSGLNRKRI